LRAQEREKLSRGAGAAILSPREALRHCPVLRPVMGGPAAGRLAAALASDGRIPNDLAALGITVESVSPGRQRVMQDSLSPE
jgi:hypothetical protein